MESAAFAFVGNREETGPLRILSMEEKAGVKCRNGFNEAGAGTLRKSIVK